MTGGLLDRILRWGERMPLPVQMAALPVCALALAWDLARGRSIIEERPRRPPAEEAWDPDGSGPLGF